MKINLPNPDNYLHEEDAFWEQLELAIYHAKKAWEKTKKRYTAEDIKEENYPWLSFSLGIDKAPFSDHIDEIDPDYKDRQEIAIEINEL